MTRPTDEEILEAHSSMTDLEVFREGLEELLFINRELGGLARAMGSPVWDRDQPTAYVTYDSDRKSVVFAVNPDFLRSITTEECAGVIGHEAHHVILEHLKDFTDPIYTDRDALIKAQECIINDTLDTVYSLPLPPIGVLRGEDIAGTDCTPLSTYGAYELIRRESEKSGGESEGEDGESSESGQAGSSGAGSSESDAAAKQAEVTPGCGGVQIGKVSEDKLSRAVEGLIGEAADELGMSVEEFKDSVNNSSGGGYSPTGASVSEATQYTRERMNWRLLLAKINPKVMEAGKRVKTRNDWTRYNRRMGSVYPNVILPVTKRIEPKADDSGDSLPVMVIALDLSGSIDRSLVKTLQGLLNEIPEDLIKAYPCTWGSNLIPYVPNGRVAGGGTNIHSVSSYVERVKRETGTDPYVLVITDGEFTDRFPRPGKEWFFMGVDKRSLRTLRHGSGWGNNGHVKPHEEVYYVGDFKV